MESGNDQPWVKAALTAVLILVISIFIFRLGTQASADVRIDDATVWAEHGLAGEVVQINASNGEIMSRVEVSEPGEEIEAVPHQSGAVILNRTTGTVRLIDNTTLRASPTMALDIANVDETEFLGGGESPEIYALGPTGVVELDVMAAEQKSRSDEADLGSAVLSPDGRLLAVDPSGPFVRRLGPNGFGPHAPLSPVTGSAPEPKLVVGGDAVYVVEQDRLSVSPLLDDGDLGPPTCFTGSGDSSLIAGTVADQTMTTRIVAHDTEAARLAVGEPGRQLCFEIELDFLGQRYGRPVIAGDLAYLPNWDLGRIDVVDLGTRTAVGSVAFSSTPGEPFELEAFGSTVVANEPQGPFAALLDGIDVVTIQKVESVVVGSGISGDSGAFGAATPLVADSEAGTGAQALGDQGGQVAGENGPDVGDGDVELIEAEVLGIAVDNVERLDEGELVADFGFSTDRAVVGEVVRFVDRSRGAPVEWTWEFGDGTGSTDPEVDKSWDRPGEYQVQLSVADAAGNTSATSALISVVPASTLLPPVADFVFDSSVVEAGTPLEFTSLTTGDVDTLEWTFGDGAVATGVQVSHTYLAIGEFTVTLVAGNSAGSTTASTTISVIEATQPPIAAMRPLPRSVEVGQFVTLESVSANDPTVTRWDFGDGRGGSGEAVRHAWSSPGTYRIRLSVENSAGSDTTVADLRVVPRVDPPDARFTETARDTLVGEPITFTDLSVNKPTSIEWDFGDGVVASGSVVSHSWSQPGTYQVTLRVANEAGRDRRSKSIQVIRPVDPPIASFQLSSSRVPLGTAIQFSDTSVNEPNRWLWAFGDGATSNLQFPSHTYSNPGVYNVRLRVGNKAGVATSEATVTVFGPPAPAFDMQADGLSVTFWDKTTGDPTSWRWVTSTGETSSEQNPTVAFDDPGTYEMTLVASNAAGDSSPLTREITVYDQPEARYNYEELFLTVRFTNRSEGGPTAYLWDFGDGTTSTEESPSHDYDEPGAYDVTLTASNPTGEDSITRRIRIDAEPLEADFDCERDGLTVTCDASDSTGAASYSWSAPGATTIEGATERVARFTFPPCGRFTIVLEVADGRGDTDTESRRTPRLGDSELPEITRVRVESNEDLLVELRGTARNDPDWWGWSIAGAELVDGGGTRSPTFSFPAPGSYDGVATASNVCGDSDPFTFTVDVDGPVVDPVDPDA